MLHAILVARLGAQPSAADPAVQYRQLHLGFLQGVLAAAALREEAMAELVRSVKGSGLPQAADAHLHEACQLVTDVAAECRARQPRLQRLLSNTNTP